MKRLIYILALIAIFAGCTSRHYDPRLEEINNLASEDAGQAIARLDSIDVTALSSSDRNYYDFLTIKTRDKADITVLNDSIILKVIDFSVSNDKKLYPEALYYGGRVYTELGDYPSAVRYFQQALDCVDPEDIKLKGNIISQTGSLLNNLRLYKQAIPYVREVSKIDSLLNDSLYLMYDFQLLGAIYMHDNNTDSAEFFFNKSKELSEILCSDETPIIDLYLSKIKIGKGEVESSLDLCRGIINKVDSSSVNFALAYLCTIYKKAGIKDSALLYANQLITSKSDFNKEVGFKVLLSDEFKGYLPTDSFESYLTKYSSLLQKSLSRSELEAALIQRASYNYHVHETNRLKAEEKNDRLLMWIIIGLGIIMVLSAISIYLKYRNKIQLIQLYEALNQIKTLRMQLRKTEEASKTVPDSDQLLQDNVSRKDLRKDILNELQMIRQDQNFKFSVSPDILSSKEYAQLLQSVKDNKPIHDSDVLWQRLEELISKVHPQFKTRLYLLMGGKLRDSELRTAMLIKCGIPPKQMAIIVGRAKNTISYRRDIIGSKIFDDNFDLSLVDDIIRLL